MTHRYAPALLALALAACAAPKPDAPAADIAPPAAAARPAADVLPAHRWDLTTAIDAGGRSIDALLVNLYKPLQLEFSGDRLQVHNGCNRISGRYRLDGAQLQTAAMAQTRMACADGKMMLADAAISERLGGSPTLQLDAGDPPTLTLRTNNRDVLVFRGVPTAEIRYDGPGTVTFLEVAAQRKACSHPLIANMQCLQVRERHYDARGIASAAPGEWQALYQDIEGYEHRDDQRVVLRVKRYTLKNPPADASSVAYVLDMVVESEVVPAKK